MRIPEALARRLAAESMLPVETGLSGDVVLRVTLADGSPAYLKAASGGRRRELRRERDVLRWLSGYWMAPRLLQWLEADERAFLLLGELRGQPAAELAGDTPPEVLVAPLARGLRRLHSMRPTGCPFDRTLPVVLAEARRRAREGLVDLAALDAERQGWSVRQLLAELEARRPAAEDLVVVHGDYTPANILLRFNEVEGCVDWGRAGVADRYQDIALLLRDLSDDSTEWVEEVFCREYGVPALDRDKLAFYQLLDEFF